MLSFLNHGETLLQHLPGEAIHQRIAHKLQVIPRSKSTAYLLALVVQILPRKEYDAYDCNASAHLSLEYQLQFAPTAIKSIKDLRKKSILEQMAQTGQEPTPLLYGVLSCCQDQPLTRPQAGRSYNGKAASIVLGMRLTLPYSAGLHKIWCARLWQLIRDLLPLC